jgi:hypothetical protein
MPCRAKLFRSTALSTLASVTALALSVGLAHASSDMYDVQIAEAKATVGAKGKASVTIVGKNGWHVNEDAPVSMKLAPGSGITVDKPKLTKADLAERTQDRARFDVAFTAAEAGKKTIDAEATFVMCQASACKPVKEKVTLAVEVAGPKK